MTTLLTKLVFAALGCGVLLLPIAANSQDNPHWSNEGCGVCHQGAAPVEGSVTFTAADTETLCESCHGDRGDAHPCRHRSMVPVTGMNVDKGLEGFLQDGRVMCTTCHDVIYQCEHPRAAYRFENPGFLRDRSSKDSGAYCEKCHESSLYEKLNPHTGIAGVPARPTCRLCHDGVPESNLTGGLNVEFNMEQDLNDACRGCHVVSPHPRGLFSRGATEEWFHLVAPSDNVLATMKKTELETGVSLPLSSINGEVFCGTCHDPHGFKAGAKQHKHRLRVTPICQACHEK